MRNLVSACGARRLTGPPSNRKRRGGPALGTGLLQASKPADRESHYRLLGRQAGLLELAACDLAHRGLFGAPRAPCLTLVNRDRSRSIGVAIRTLCEIASRGGVGITVHAGVGANYDVRDGGVTRDRCGRH